jgi:uncharacterized membrane protein
LKRDLRNFMAGVLIITPIAVTVWLIVTVGKWLGRMGYELASATGLANRLDVAPEYVAWFGVGVAVVTIYVIGMLANFWIFGKAFNLVDKMLSRVPGVKIIYESVRDLLQLFGSDSKDLGRVAIYTEPLTGQQRLGIVTNESPAGRIDGDSVLVYLPMAYMIGGPIVYAKPAELEYIDMPVEMALKLAATAFIGGAPQPDDGA